MPASMPAPVQRARVAGIIQAVVSVLAAAQHSMVSVPAAVRPCAVNADPTR